MDVRSGFGLWLLVLGVLAVVGVGAWLVQSTTRVIRCPPYPPYRPMENLRNLTFILSDRGEHEGWPPYAGKNFVLSLVAYGDVDPAHPDDLAVFFASEDEGRVPPAAAYREVTTASLRERRFSALTDFAGRRNTDPRYRLPPVDDLHDLDDQEGLRGR
ncbi:MAG: hypothetical protein ACC662_12135, partial [Planctomycetota bacterium]